jgi:hypothetical protein
MYTFFFWQISQNPNRAIVMQSLWATPLALDFNALPLAERSNGHC